MLHELKMAARALAKRPGYAAIAAFTLALGIAANVAIFTVVDAVLLNPLPYPAADRIVIVRHHAPGLDLPDLDISPGLAALYREEARTLTRLAAYETGELNLTVNGRPDRVETAQVTPEIFDILAVRPSLGRPFREPDAHKGAPRVVILTHGLWQSRFGGDPGVVGRRIELDGVRAEVVGIMPAGFAFPDAEARILVPLWLDPAGGFGSFSPEALARLAPGVSLEAARREITALQRRIPERFPDLPSEFLDRAGWSATVTPLRDHIVADISTMLWILFGTVGLVLLMAGANVANLFLVRAESRQREMAVRAALGAGRWRLARAFLAESLALAVAGGIAGSLMAWGAVRLLLAYSPADLPRLHEVKMDGTVLAFAAALILCVGVVLGALPMLHLAGRSFVALLRDGGRGATASRSRHRMRQLLIGGQVAVALVLLVASTLMLRSAARLYAVDPGIRVEDVVTVGVSLGSRPERAQGIAFYQQVLEQVAALPGVVSGAAASTLPIGATGFSGGSFDIESRPRPEQELPPVAMYMAVTPGYFETLGVPLLAGRAPEWVDATRERQVAWVNQTLARTFLENEAIGERIRLEGIEFDIVGVVGDIRSMGLREEIRPSVYMTLGSAAVPLDVMQVVVRTSATPATIAPLLRQAVDRVDASVPLATIRTMADVVARSLAETWFTMVLLACAAGGALVLGLVGLYGVIRYIVAQRTPEIGVRIALGARPRDVRMMVLRQGLTVTLAGVGAGLVMAWASSRIMESLLFEVSAHDPATFGLVALLLTAVSALATYLPARTAASIDPSRALRQDA
jgi:predicted permease